jgi:hypothetical protein
MSIQNTYKEIEKYPIPKEVIRYINPPNRDYKYKSTFHDIIQANLTALVPNIELGYHYNHTTEDIEKWIDKTEEYARLLYRNVKRKCAAQKRKLEKMKTHEQRTRELDINKLMCLPDDMIRCIYEFLMPETRITLLVTRYPTYVKSLEMLTSDNLKKYLKDILQKYIFGPVFEYNPEFPDRQSCCITNRPTFYVSFSKKSDGVKQITNLFDTINNPIPKKQEYVRYYKNHALKLLMSMIYVSNYKPSLRKNPKRPKPTENVVAAQP